MWESMHLYATSCLNIIMVNGWTVGYIGRLGKEASWKGTWLQSLWTALIRASSTFRSFLSIGPPSGRFTRPVPDSKLECWHCVFCSFVRFYLSLSLSPLLAEVHHSLWRLCWLMGMGATCICQGLMECHVVLIGRLNALLARIKFLGSNYLWINPINLQKHFAIILWVWDHAKFGESLG